MARSVSESMASPKRLLKCAIHNLTAQESSSTATSAAENSTGVGAMIFSIEERMSSMPISSTSTATTNPERYS